jgi:predicted pyridoxine 5'-phosphate oxidase superfamily flavin-nucleotide-binding protein
MTEPALRDQVPRLLAANAYCVLATADEHGTPWATPVYFAARGTDELFWVSSADSRHSRNLAVRPDVAVTVFDSTVPVGGAEALYLTARAAPADDVDAALATLNGKLPADRQLEPADLVPDGPLTAYRAVVVRHEVLVRGGDPSFDNVVDGRREVTP